MGRGLIARWGLCRDALLFMLVVELYASGRDRRMRSNVGCMLMSHKRTGGVYVKKINLECSQPSCIVTSKVARWVVRVAYSCSNANNPVVSGKGASVSCAGSLDDAVMGFRRIGGGCDECDAHSM